MVSPTFPGLSQPIVAAAAAVAQDEYYDEEEDGIGATVNNTGGFKTHDM